MDEPSNKMRKLEPRCSYNNQDALTFSSSSDFYKIRKAPTFVDKTLLIKDLFEAGDYAEEPVVLVTAPRRFGKSVNMSMIEHFLEKQVDWNTGTEIQSKRQDSNTTLFANLKIMEHEELVKKHFGNYAVLKISYLSSDPITNVQEALNFYKAVIRDAYKKHRYLCNSRNLNEHQQNICKQWCHDEDYLKKDNVLVSGALKNLSQYLHLHCEGKLKVFVLLDEYDSPFFNAMSNIKDKNILKLVVHKGIAILNTLVKDNDYVTGAFLTGISHLAGLGLSSTLGNVSSHRFLKKGNKFTAYYGFSQSEVDCLFEKCGVSDAQKKEARLYYNGYHSEDGKRSVYNPWSITFFIKNRMIGNYWVMSGAVQGLLPALRRTEELKTEIGNALLLSNKNSHFTCLDKLEESDFYRLHALISESNEIPTSAVFSTFLLEQGYLTFCGDEGFLKIPNEEVKLTLHRKLTDDFTQMYGIQKLDKDDCRISFSNLFSSRTADVTVFITNLKNKIEKLVTPLKKRNTALNHDILQQILFIPLFETQYRYSTEIYSAGKKRPDFFLYKQNHGVIMELKYMPSDGSHSDSEQALRQILETGYYVLFGDSEYFEDFAETFVLIGLSFNSELQVSVHCLPSSKVSEYHHLTTKEGLENKLKKKDIDTLLTMASVASFNRV